MDPLSYTNTTHVTVIDQRMGSGKSTWAIQYIDSLPDDKHTACVIARSNRESTLFGGNR